ncbi:MAG TPA: PAS domain S-box protein [Candidatus Magasanikbacteria bacterium]|nr:PAS domain S-box protein [Candidatus Magasanikbacteria bacterium]
MNTQTNLSPVFLNSILNSIADPVFVKDDQFKFVYVNDALCEILGMDRKDIIGKTLGESLPKDQMEHFLKVDKGVLDTGKENISEEELTGKGGKILLITTKKTRYTDENGKRFVVGIIRDETVRKQAELDLREKMDQLQKMNELMVGRELMMTQLKEENSALKNNMTKDGV